jgi:hypothetical protein
MNTNQRFGFTSRWPVACGLVLLLALLPLAPASTRSSAAPVNPDTSGLAVTFTQVADSSMAIPDGTGTFTNFPYSPALDGGSITLVGTGVGGQQGVYRFGPSPPPIKVADLNTAIPNGAGNFTGFGGAPTISGEAVAFLGTGAGGQQGIYRFGPIPPPIKVADLFTPIPNGTGNFLSLPLDPSISGNLVAFIGNGSGEQQGVYLANTLPIPPPITPIADTNTAIPGGSGNFTRFVPPNPVAPSISGNYVVFFGAGSNIGQEGIFLVDTSGPTPPPIIPVADGNTTIPGGTGNFQFFTTFASEGNDVAFVGGHFELDEFVPGVYKVLNVLGPNPPPIKVADLFTAVPSGIGTFTSFGSVAIDPGTVVFEGLSDDGAGGTRKGLYTDFGGTLSKLIATGYTLGGKTVSDLRFGFRGFNNHQVAFAVDFSDGTHAVFMATLSQCSIGFAGFHEPIGGADSTGGTYNDPVRAFKLKSTVPVKMTLTSCDGQPLTTGVHTIQVIKFSNATTSDPPIDATPTDAATTGNEFRLTDSATGEWHFNLSTKSLTMGVWQIKATLSDGSMHTAFIELK